MPPLSKKNVFDHADYSIYKRCGAKINITGCEDYENTFARKSLIARSNLALRFL